VVPARAVTFVRLGAGARARAATSLRRAALRHTFASILIALGRDPRFVMEQLGHTRLKAFAGAGVLAPIGTVQGESLRTLESLVGAAGFEPATSRV
jgi:hypothetical protein